MRIRLLLIGAAACLGAHFAWAKDAGAPLRFGKPSVTLTGKLVVKEFFGPPGYGEDPKTDSKERQFVLILSSPIDVQAGKDPGMGNDTTEEKSVEEVTLTGLTAKKLKGLLNKTIEIKGTLFHAITGHHHTPALMMVESFKTARNLSRPENAGSAL